MVQEVGREGTAVVAQHLRRRLQRPVARIEPAFGRHAVAFAQVAARAGGDDVLPRRMAAARARHDVIEGEVVRRKAVAAILADEAVAQEDVEPGEGRPARQGNVRFERDDARQLYLERRAAHDAIVLRDDVDALEADGLDRLLPGPERQREITQRAEIRVEHERRTTIERDRQPASKSWRARAHPCRALKPKKYDAAMSSRWSARRYRLVAVIIVESAAGLASEPAGLDVFDQQWAGPVLRIGEALVEHLHHRETRVEADEIGQLERPHGVVGAEF